MALRYIREMRFNFMELPLPPLAHRAFIATVPAALARSGFRRRLDLRLSDLRRHHRDSPLSVRVPGPGRGSGARAGDRVPDALVVPAEPGPEGPGEAVRLQRLLGYGTWTLVVHAGRADAVTLGALRAACAAVPVRVRPLAVTPADGRAAAALGDPGELRLVRPDGYVGLVAPLGRVDRLRAYLTGPAAGSRAAGRA
ncbi:aromatic-ring hydroxylase C-terminal domain-containing protein [Streptomyces hydrogenans]|uniref:aromatic-ring hydroxylase C-terminal domain-containing protein n=1 Tax=Streptomyces hydrogenans TaxID=1873719 RepID=UPI0035E0E0C9